GASGVGDSTIVSEFCRRLSDRKRLGASFFFTRRIPEHASTRFFFNTIAFQLANMQPDALHNIIVSAAWNYLKHGGGAQQQQMGYACEDLVRGPFRELAKLDSHPPIFLVIDGLDQCTGE
ncbi:hypothetical protein C8Q76DRAFT_603465, partial [Earliella scabrosa]